MHTYHIHLFLPPAGVSQLLLITARISVWQSTKVHIAAYETISSDVYVLCDVYAL